MNQPAIQAPFNDRTDAGRQLALDLPRYLQGQDTIILALPMGGVPVAAAVASELKSRSACSTLMLRNETKSFTNNIVSR